MSDDLGVLSERALVQSWRQLATAMPGGRVWERDGIAVTATGVPVPPNNPGLVAATPVDPQAAVEWGVQVRRDHGIPGGGYDVPAGRHPTVERALSALGHHVLLVRPMMVAPVDALVARPVAVDVRPVVTDADLAAYQACQVRGFGSDPALAPAQTPWEAVRQPGACYMVAWADDEPVACAAATTVCATAGVFGVATVPEHRGRGYGSAVTAAAVRASAALGARVAWLQASEMGTPVYRAMGFRPVDQWVVWVGVDG